MRAELIALTARQQSKRINGIVTYFMQAEEGGPIKIGRCNWDVIEVRVQTLQCGTPHRLVVRSILEGDREDEMHRRFDDARIVREWFYPSPRLVSFARAVPSEIPADGFAIKQARIEGYRKGWHDAARKIAASMAEVAAETVRLALSRDGIEELSPATTRFERKLESDTTRPQGSGVT